MVMRDGEKLTMEQRTQAFYRQSGGPGNPKIQEFLNNHLLYGKDHGPQGYRENIEDAFIDMVVSDSSMLVLFQRFQRWRNTNRAKTDATHMETLQREIAALRDEVVHLKSMLEQTNKEDSYTKAGLGVQHGREGNAVTG